MKIISFSYFDKSRSWGFENLEFSNLTLLVGASGVGKTQILRSIDNLKNIANGQSLNGVKWEVIFESLDKKIYNWQGEFEEKESTLLNSAKNDAQEKPLLLWEYISEDGKEIAKRNENGIIFQGKETVRLAGYLSLIYLLKAEPTIEIIENGIAKIKMLQTFTTNSAIYMPELAIEKAIEICNHSNKDILLKSDASSNGIKLLIASRLKDDYYFQSIKNRYIDIFPQVEDIRITRETPSSSFNSATTDKYIIQIKEKGVEKWISQEDMSSGMLRSLMQISELYLSPEGSVLLMDEFENSLGVNCIDELTNDILSAKRNIQFILTSHHPYIINNIPYRNWKIVTRKAGKVMIKNASDYRIGESRHDYFMQLLQLEDFTNGVD